MTKSPSFALMFYKIYIQSKKKVEVIKEGRKNLTKSPFYFRHYLAKSSIMEMKISSNFVVFSKYINCNWIIPIVAMTWNLSDLWSIGLSWPFVPNSLHWPSSVSQIIRLQKILSIFWFSLTKATVNLFFHLSKS